MVTDITAHGREIMLLTAFEHRLQNSRTQNEIPIYKTFIY